MILKGTILTFSNELLYFFTYWGEDTHYKTHIFLIQNQCKAARGLKGQITSEDKVSFYFARTG